ncbi:glycerophosphodiester phosphodiesterase [Ruoffia tabacinasalis]|uniref:glycerophosphodiester phosphodiesterase n=1 Tax=Ruoffia tabacinasalis TaxID=87458 RepID=UPI003F9EB405
MKSIVKKALGLGSIIAPIWYAIYAWPQSDESMPFFEKKKTRTYNIAHRGGGALAPEETLEAFAKSEEAGADMFEYDVHITKDGHLIASHDATVDRITTGTGYINDLTLTEIKALDAGEKFVDVNGESPYKGQGVQLATVEEIFLLFPHKRAVIELKDTNRPELYEAMNQEIWRLIQQYNMEDKVIIASFDHKINQRFKEISNGQVAIGAGESEATSYLTRMILRLNGIAHTDAQAFQLPINQHGLDLTQKNIINGSRQRGIDVYYWTINDVKTMRDLIAKGVDGIMTDNPELLEKVLNEG